MENQLEDQLSKLVGKSIEIAEKTGEFVVDQAPELLKEFYNWHIATCIFFIVFAIFIVIIGRILPTGWLSKEKDYYDTNFFGRHGDEGAVVGYAVFFVCSLIGLIMFFTNIYDLVFILVAPKIYLIEYFIK
jgi:hypothetical protein